ncbi:ISAzo13 family transposase [Planosporangium mesophilum]|uniref:Transposase Helix-turn-helix domain-containing protein n=1 Tax=Planosporangium mesophilum TaxID=689768 RepID=A0A8J3TIS0_9ACTN|nr:ISAzo13 family transposase [Planosporangium mesophilum]GII26492.1 hypothetical protein Pme01_60890 [Planosporangium mesophilum]
MDRVDEDLAVKLHLLPHLDERQRRLLLGAEARMLGHGGIRRVARAAGVAEGTVSRGVSELEAGDAPLGRARRAGGGRKRLVDLDAGLRPALLALVEPDMRGDPMSPLRWTTKSTRKLVGELLKQGWRISADTVADILRAEGFSLQANAKTLEGSQHPDRDAQFRYLNDQARAFRADGQPVISVDTKKKELVGAFANNGREWRPAGQPVAVNTHDFPGCADGKAVPYGVYDTTTNTGWVNVGCDHDTAAFAVASIRRWWQAAGHGTYPQATRLLITADAGGSNGYRCRAWKTELAALAAETGLTITVCHLPPGTSKWNAIEHRLFSHITTNWRGRPLSSHEVVVNTIAATTTRTGLRVDAALDQGSYPTGIRINDAQIAALPIARHAFHGDWNYTLHPQSTGAPSDPAGQAQIPVPAQWDRDSLAHPTLTGMPTEALTALTADLDGLRQVRWQDKQREHHQGLRRHAPRSGRPPSLSFPDRVLATILHLRLHLPEDTLAVLLDTSRTTIRRALRETQQLLDEHGIAVQHAPADSPAIAGMLAAAGQAATVPRSNQRVNRA